MGKGKGPEKGRVLPKYRSGFDGIDFSKKGRPENRMVSADELESRTAAQRKKNGLKHARKADR